MSQQNNRGGYSGSRGRSSRPYSGAYHHQRHDGVNKPFANDSFGSKDGMSQGRGKYSHNMSRGSGSKHFNGKPSSNYVYRQKSPATDVIPNSPEAGESQLRQPECLVACGDGLHSFASQSDSKTPTPDLIQNSPEAERSHMNQPESFSSPELVSGADLPILPVHSDSRNIHLDMTRMQIKETPEEKTEETTTVNNDFSFSGEVKDEWMGKEPLPPAKADIQEQAFQEKDVKNLAGIGGSGHSVQQPVEYLFDVCPRKTGSLILLKPMSRGSGSKQFNGKPSSNYVYRQKSPATDVIPNSPEAGESQLRQPECLVACGDGLHSFASRSDSKTHTPDLIQNSPEAERRHMNQPESFSSPGLVSGADLPILPVHSDSRNIHLDMTRMQIKETPEEKTEETTTVNNDFSFSGEVKDEWMGKEPLLPAKADIQEKAFQEKDVKNLAGIGGSGHSVPQPVEYLFDICPPKTGSLILLKPSLLVTNRHKRNQVKLDMEGQNGKELRSGMVLLKNYLSISDQVKILKECRNLGLGPGGFYQPGYRDGAILNLKMMCLGKNWDPEKSEYEDIRSRDGAKPPIIPAYFDQLVRKAIQDSHALIRRDSGAQNVETKLPRMSPDICIVNFYTASGKLGLHQDRDESHESLDKRLPVVSFSIGDTAEFLYGNERDVHKADKVNLESGDVLVFGGESRHIFHGVSQIITKTTPKTLQEETNIRPGRLNLTFRQY